MTGKEIREHLDAARVLPSKQLGQNFLLDLNLTAKIARSAGDLSGCDVLEVGPGPGGLTRGLLAEGARRVVAVEKDIMLAMVLMVILVAVAAQLLSVVLVD